MHLLQKLFRNVYITQVVAEEFLKPLPEWIIVQNPLDKRNQIILEASLDKGEASSIALAMEHQNCLLIIDELKGRRLAEHLSISFTGTLGILVQAKLSGHLAEVKPVLEE